MRRIRPDAVVVRSPEATYGMLGILVAKLEGARLIPLQSRASAS